jgi:hypothetical protein
MRHSRFDHLRPRFGIALAAAALLAGGNLAVAPFSLATAVAFSNWAMAPRT